MKEIWRKIPNIPQYEISNTARVRNIKSGAILSAYTDRYGYLAITLRISKGIKRNIPLHRLMALAFIGIPKQGEQVNHKNGIRTDNGLDNLEWVTASENIKHSYEILNRWRPIGQFNGQSKLTPKDVFKIREMLKMGAPQKEIGKIFDIDQSTVSNIKSGKLWPHL